MKALKSFLGITRRAIMSAISAAMQRSCSGVSVGINVDLLNCFFKSIKSVTQSAMFQSIVAFFLPILRAFLKNRNFLKLMIRYRFMILGSAFRTTSRRELVFISITSLSCFFRAYSEFSILNLSIFPSIYCLSSQRFNLGITLQPNNVLGSSTFFSSSGSTLSCRYSGLV